MPEHGITALCIAIDSEVCRCVRVVCSGVQKPMCTVLRCQAKRVRPSKSCDACLMLERGAGHLGGAPVQLLRAPN